MSLPPYDPELDSQPTRTAADDLVAADESIDYAASLNHSNPDAATVRALLGIGRALTAMVRQQSEFYREVADVLTSAKSDGE